MLVVSSTLIDSYSHDKGSTLSLSSKFTEQTPRQNTEAVRGKTKHTLTASIANKMVCNSQSNALD